MTEKPREGDDNLKQGKKNNNGASKNSRRIWDEAKKEIIPLSLGSVALVASSSVNQGVYVFVPNKHRV